MIGDHFVISMLLIYIGMLLAFGILMSRMIRNGEWKRVIVTGSGLIAVALGISFLTEIFFFLHSSITRGLGLALLVAGLLLALCNRRIVSSLSGYWPALILTCLPVVILSTVGSLSYRRGGGGIDSMEGLLFWFAAIGVWLVTVVVAIVFSFVGTTNEELDNIKRGIWTGVGIALLIALLLGFMVVSLT